MSKTRSQKALIRKTDKLWSFLTKTLWKREKSDICPWCNKQKIHASDHIISRRHRATRWELSNFVPLCVGCHMYRKQYDPMEWALFVLETKGADVVSRLVSKSRLTPKPTDYWLAYLELVKKEFIDCKVI